MIIFYMLLSFEVFCLVFDFSGKKSYSSKIIGDENSGSISELIVKSHMKVTFCTSWVKNEINFFLIATKVVFVNLLSVLD